LKSRKAADVVQHTITVNTNQAVVPDSVLTGKNSNAASSGSQEFRASAKPCWRGKEARKRNEHQPHAKGPCFSDAKPNQSELANDAARGWTVCRMHGAPGGTPEGNRNGTTGTAPARRRRSTLEVHQIAALNGATTIGLVAGMQRGDG